jgi:hypothetical protein
MLTASLNQASFSQDESHGLPDSFSASSEKRRQLTIHRRTISHHGSTLRILGHAAEYLTDLQTLSIESPDAGDCEAIHILMRLSREVFDEYAQLTRQHHPVTDWIMNRAIRVYGAA